MMIAVLQEVIQLSGKYEVLQAGSVICPMNPRVPSANDQSSQFLAYIPDNHIAYIFDIGLPFRKTYYPFLASFFPSHVYISP